MEKLNLWSAIAAIGLMIGVAGCCSSACKEIPAKDAASEKAAIEARPLTISLTLSATPVDSSTYIAALELREGKTLLGMPKLAGEFNVPASVRMAKVYEILENESKISTAYFGDIPADWCGIQLMVKCQRRPDNRADVKLFGIVRNFTGWENNITGSKMLIATRCVELEIPAMKYDTRMTFTTPVPAAPLKAEPPPR